MANTYLNTRKIVTGTGITLIVPGVMALLSIPVCLIYKEFREIWGFIWTAAISIPIGILSYYLRAKKKYHIIEMVIITSLGWFIVTLIGTIPLWYQGILAGRLDTAPEDMLIFSNFMNAFFESVSGFTGTGLTMAQHEATLSFSMLWWRTFMQWIGGIGIIVMVTFFHNPRLYTLERYHEKDDFSHVLPNANVNFNKSWWIYVVLSVFSITLLLLSGVPAWEAINHGLTGLATGGFTVTSESYTEYSSNIKFVTIIIMILGALSFNLYYKLMKKGSIRRFISNTQVMVFFILLITGSFFMVLLNKGTKVTATDSIFQTVSALATCGFQSSNLNLWSLTAIMILSILMMIGGTTDSTTGGIKVFRFWIFLKSIFVNSSRILFHPKRPLKVHMNDKKLNIRKRNANLLSDTYIFLLLWLFIYITGSLIMVQLLQGDYSLEQILFETSSAFGNVGLSSGITSSGLLPLGKIVLIIIMLAGRLELMPVFILLGLIFRSEKKNK